jgi:hypothetical protein
VPGITAVPSEENLRYFNVTIQGPDQSPYEGGVFKLELFLPDDYPSKFFRACSSRYSPYAVYCENYFDENTNNSRQWLHQK